MRDAGRWKVLNDAPSIALKQLSWSRNLEINVGERVLVCLVVVGIGVVVERRRRTAGNANYLGGTRLGRSDARDRGNERL